MYIGTANFKVSRQRDDYSCGARCVYMILRHFGRKVRYSKIKEQCLTTSNGTNVHSLLGVLRFYGLEVGVRPKMSIRSLRDSLKKNAVVLVHVDVEHFAVVYGRCRRFTYIADPDKTAPNKHLNSVFKVRWNCWGLVVSEKQS